MVADGQKLDASGGEKATEQIRKRNDSMDPDGHHYATHGCILSLHDRRKGKLPPKISERSKMVPKRTKRSPSTISREQETNLRPYPEDKSRQLPVDDTTRRLTCKRCKETFDRKDCPKQAETLDRTEVLRGENSEGEDNQGKVKRDKRMKRGC
jgi:hypothetical protein